MMCRQKIFLKGRTAILVIIALQIWLVVRLFFHHGDRIRSTKETHDTGNAYKSDATNTWSTLLPQTVQLMDHNDPYFVQIEGHICFKNGIDLAKSKEQLGCVCLTGYHGNDCGIPDPVWNSLISSKADSHNVIRRTKPRRVIHVLIVNTEFEMFDVRLNELKDIVDVFIVGESNYSMIGEPKPLSFLNSFKTGFMQQFFSKIIYVLQPFFPPEAKYDGWLGQSYPRRHTSEHGLPRVKNLRDDDLFLTFDADEIPSREVITFLKLYDGYDEPIAFRLRWTVFGYYWKICDSSGLNRPTQIVAGCTVGFLRKYLRNDAQSLRAFGADEHCPEGLKLIANNCRDKGWTVGTADHPAGHHCSWCMPVDDIITKLKNANKEDKPRWGDYPEKLDPNYIEKLRRFGIWFSETDFFTKSDVSETYYAPGYVRTNFEKYGSLWKHPVSF